MLDVVFMIHGIEPEVSDLTDKLRRSPAARAGWMRRRAPRCLWMNGQQSSAPAATLTGGGELTEGEIDMLIERSRHRGVPAP